MIAVYWTEPALDDLRGIHSYIAQDSKVYAANFTARILEAVDRLEEFPLSGRRVAEFSTGDVREVVFRGYRILYWVVSPNRIDIIAVIHGSQDLSAPENQPWKRR